MPDVNPFCSPGVLIPKSEPGTLAAVVQEEAAQPALPQLSGVKGNVMWRAAGVDGRYLVAPLKEATSTRQKRAFQGEGML